MTWLSLVGLEVSALICQNISYSRNDQVSYHLGICSTERCARSRNNRINKCKFGRVEIVVLHYGIAEVFDSEKLQRRMRTEELFTMALVLLVTLLPQLGAATCGFGNVASDVFYHCLL